MSYRPRFLATLVCLAFTLPIFAEEVAFINDDLRAGLNRASGEGKLIFVEFWASYCTPCKMMEEYTFTNPSVIERLTNNYIPVKVNIQSFDGFDLKNQYKITVLPTILILDSKGRQIARYEETMSASKLNAVLDKYDIPQNRSRPAMLASNNTNFTPHNNRPTHNTAPYLASVSSAGARPAASTHHTNTAPRTAPTTSQTTVSRPTSTKPYTNTAPHTAPIAHNNTTTPSNNNTPQRAKPVASAAPTTASKEVGDRREIPSTGFTIQVGAYGLVSSAQGAIEDIKSKTNGQKQYIMQSKLAGGKVTFRILIGSFASRQEAEVYRKKVALDGYVRSFGEFAKK